jgi:hypothetical protein
LRLSSASCIIWCCSSLRNVACSEQQRNRQHNSQQRAQTWTGQRLSSASCTTWRCSSLRNAACSGQQHDPQHNSH